jgi:hypothetical protein
VLRGVFRGSNHAGHWHATTGIQKQTKAQPARRPQADLSVNMLLYR